MKFLINKLKGTGFLQIAMRLIHSPLRVAGVAFRNDMVRFRKYSGSIGKCSSQEASLARIIMFYHVIEKGLSMPERKSRFGGDRARLLKLYVEQYIVRYGMHKQVLHAISVLKEYRSVCVASEWLDPFLAQYAYVEASVQPTITRDEFFRYAESAFDLFATSRHSVRNYTSDPISTQTITSAIDLARTAPSACNRQHSSVIVVRDRELISKILAIQGGARGFGHLASMLLVVVGELQDTLSIGERNDVYLNGGIFLMNLCYSLHFYKIAHCLLNWSKSDEEDKLLRSLLPISDSKVVLAVVSCGIPPNEFRYCNSPRKDVTEFIKGL